MNKFCLDFAKFPHKILLVFLKKQLYICPLSFENTLNDSILFIFPVVFPFNEIVSRKWHLFALKVINWQTSLHIPPQAKLTPEASDLIIKLCRGPEDRLGKNGADEIKAHPFFKTIDFSSDLRRQSAFYIPKIAHPTDTSNFDPVDPDKLWSDDDKEGNVNDTLNGWYKNGKHPEHAFYEFTFRRFFDDNGYPYNNPKPIEYEYGSSQNSEQQSDDDDDEEQAGRGVQNRDLVYV